MEKFEIIQDIVTADAEDLHINYKYGEISLSYKNWQEQAVSIVFHDVVAHRVGPFGVGIPREDSAYTVLDSSWVDHNKEAFVEYQNAWMPEEEGNFHHYKLSFNALDVVIDVLAVSIEIVKQ